MVNPKWVVILSFGLLFCWIQPVDAEPQAAPTRRGRVGGRTAGRSAGQDNGSREELLKARELRRKAAAQRRAERAKAAGSAGGNQTESVGKTGAPGAKSVIPSPGVIPPGASKASAEPTEDSDNPWSKVAVPEDVAAGIEYKKPKKGTRFSFNLVDTDLIDLVKIIGNITGKAFILGSKTPRIKATVYAPTKITAAEAYQVFLSVLQVNGLTVMPSGRYLKILPITGATAQNTPIIKRGNVPTGDQIVTRLHHLKYVSAEEISGVLDRFKSPEGDITIYAPTNMLIITDYGVSIRRLMKLIAVLDAPGTGEQIWIEPINYADASEMADRVTEVFDVEATARKAKKTTTPKRSSTKRKGATAAASHSTVVGEEEGETTISKIIPDERTNSLIIVASEDAYMRILDLIRQLDVPIAGEGTLHVLKLQHADAEELAKTLNSLTKGGSTSKSKKKSKVNDTSAQLFEGDVQVSDDKATNSLLVVSSLRDYIALKNVVAQLDVMRQQVFVEAVIMEVGIDTDLNLGMGLHAGRTVNTAGEQSLVYGKSQPGNVDSMNISTALLSGLATGMVGPAIPESEELVGMSIPSFGVALNALQTNSDVNILATPNIIATDNNEASIQVGENVPISMGYSPGGSLLNSAAASALGGATGSSSALGALGGLGGLGGVRYKRQDVGLTLKITPQINDDEQVQLEIELEVSSIKSADPVAGPNISKKKASTTSVVGDQQTVVIGGLVNDRETKTIKKVPILGDIPILGFLFRHKTSLKQKSNLLIFLTPYIIRSEDDFRYIFNRKMAERREFIERWTAFENHRVDPHLDWSRTSGVISEVNRVLRRAEDDEELRRMAELSSDVEHSPKTPLGGSKEQEEVAEKWEEPAGASMSLSEVKQMLDAERGEAAEPESEAMDFEMTPVEEPAPVIEEEAP